MSRTPTFLALFVLLVSAGGILMPESSQINFLFPHFYAEVGGLVLGTGLLLGQFVDSCRDNAFTKMYGFLGIALLAFAVSITFWSTGVLHYFSSSDLFVLLPLGFSFIILWLEEAAVYVEPLTVWTRAETQQNYALTQLENSTQTSVREALGSTGELSQQS